MGGGGEGVGQAAGVLSGCRHAALAARAAGTLFAQTRPTHTSAHTHTHCHSHPGPAAGAGWQRGSPAAPHARHHAPLRPPAAVGPRVQRLRPAHRGLRCALDEGRGENALHVRLAALVACALPRSFAWPPLVVHFRVCPPHASRHAPCLLPPTAGFLAPPPAFPREFGPPLAALRHLLKDACLAGAAPYRGLQGWAWWAADGAAASRAARPLPGTTAALRPATPGTISAQYPVHPPFLERRRRPVRPLPSLALRPRQPHADRAGGGPGGARLCSSTRGVGAAEHGFE